MAAGQHYCGLCPGYGDHDTAHHGVGEVAIGDRVTVDVDGRRQECTVVEVRGHEARVVTRRKDAHWLPVRRLERTERDQRVTRR